jgi:uncharacterized coiled-coil protein SlyX
MLDECHQPPDLITPVYDSPSVVSNDAQKTAAVKAFEALRAHDNVGVGPHLDAAATIAALKETLPRGEFGPFCEGTLGISATYRGRMLRLHDRKDHLRAALVWAATQKHRLADCHSVLNLIKIVEDWLKKDRSHEPDPDLNTEKRRRSKKVTADLQQEAQETADLLVEHENVISELNSKLANRDDTIDDLRKRLAEREDDIVKLRDPLTDEVRDQALVALTSSRQSEFAAIAKRLHWCVNDLRREFEIKPR